MSEVFAQPEGSGHAVQFYECDRFLVEQIASFAAAGLAADEGVVLIATGRHLTDVEQRLRALGYDLARARSQRAYIALDAAATLASLLRGDQVDHGRLREVAGAAIREVGRSGRRVRIFGEMVALLWEQGRRQTAIRLEATWNDLARELSFRLLCACPLGGFTGESDEASLTALCAAHAEVRPHPDARPCARVLVVEDYRDAAEILEMLLGALGHLVVVCYDGPSALEAAAAQVPDLMLVDIGMPGMDGYEVARRIRRDPRLRGVRLVAMTGYGGEEDRHRAREAGFDHHLVKPAEPDTLQRLVAAIFAASEAEAR